MKKVTALLMAIVSIFCTFAFAACNAGIKASEDYDRVVKNKVLKVGLECNYKPFNWTQQDSSNGAVKINGVNLYGNGYDVMIAKEIGKALGVDVVLYACEWDGLIESLKSGIIDCVIAGMSPTDERKRQIDFSEAYYNSNLVIVCKANTELAACTTLSEADNAKYKITAQLNTFHLEALNAQTSKCVKSESKDFATMQTALESGIVDGYVAELPTALTVCLDTKYAYVPLVNNTTGFTASAADTSIAVGMRKGSSLAEKVNAAVKAITSEQRTTFMDNAIAWQSAAVEE